MSLASASALHCRSRRQISRCPFIADSCSGVLWLKKSKRKERKYAKRNLVHEIKKVMALEQLPYVSRVHIGVALQKQKAICKVPVHSRLMQWSSLVMRSVVNTIRIGNDVQKH
jgi:hypothetical protein